MINFKINGTSKAIPTTWGDVTYGQYLKLCEIDKGDRIMLVSIFTGLDYETLKKAQIMGLDALLEALTFVNELPTFPEYIHQVGPYKLPTNNKGQFNPQYESLGQFEDLRGVINKVKVVDNKYDPTDLLKSYGKMVAIYLQKIRDKHYNPSKVSEVELEVNDYAAHEVITLGTFFLLKLSSLSKVIPITSPLTPQSLKKSKSASTGSNGSTAYMHK